MNFNSFELLDFEIFLSSFFLLLKLLLPLSSLHLVLFFLFKVLATGILALCHLQLELQVSFEALHYRIFSLR